MTEIVIMAGGKGTRSGNQNIPKALQHVGEKTIIEMQLENIADWCSADIRIIGGHHGDKLKQHLIQIKEKYPNLNFEYYYDKEQKGTLPALLSIIQEIQAKKFALLLGDLVINLNWLNFLDKLNEPQVEGLVVTHPNKHPEDSDLIIQSSRDQSLTFLSKNRLASTSDGNLAVAGIFGFETELIKNVEFSGLDVTENLLAELVKKYKVENYLTVDYIKDAGTPRRMSEINLDLISGFYTNREPRNRGIIFSDLDDTLHSNLETKNSNSIIEFDQKILNGIKKINESGIPFVVVSNQPGISKGFFSFEDLDLFFRKVQSELNSRGCFIDAWYFCPHHPESGWKMEVKELKIKCSCRKPNTGLLQKFREFNNFTENKSWMLGNSVSDQDFATNGNLNFKLCALEGAVFNPKATETSKALEFVWKTMRAS